MAAAAVDVGLQVRRVWLGIKKRDLPIEIENITTQMSNVTLCDDKSDEESDIDGI